MQWFFTFTNINNDAKRNMLAEKWRGGDGLL
jgi:hypothetical protein